MIRLPVFILLWIGFLLIKAPTAFAGLFVVPLMWRYKHTHYSFLPWWTRPWANPEDWKGGESTFLSSLPKWWVDKNGTTFRSWYRYHAIRNPANGLRSFELLDLDIDPDLVRYKTDLELLRYEPTVLRRHNLGGIDANIKTAWYLAWQGWQAGFKVVHIWSDTHHLVIKLGWRIEPADAFGEDENIGTEDASFASKFLLYRKG